MASSNQRDAGRAAANFDDDRKDAKLDGREFYPVADFKPAPLAPEKQAALKAAVAQIERAFGPNAIWRAKQAEAA